VQLPRQSINQSINGTNNEKLLLVAHVDLIADVLGHVPLGDARLVGERTTEESLIVKVNLPATPCDDDVPA